MSDLQVLTAYFPSVAAGTPVDYDIPFPFPGAWQIESWAYSPNTADAADATNYTVLTLETMEAVANLAAVGGTITNATVAFVVGTARRVTAPTGSARFITGGDTIRVAKTEEGTGGIMHGVVSIVVRKVTGTP
jgi:hypothetical protein